MAIVVRPFDGEFGAELLGIDLAEPLAEASFRAWAEAFERHSVLAIRDQRLPNDRHVEVSLRFGALEDFPDAKDQVVGYPTILRVTNVERDSDRIKPIDEPGHKSFTLGTSDWHIDSSFRPVPSKASLLYAHEVPDDGGDTLFANTAMAYDALSDAEKAEIEDLVVVHDFEHTRRRFSLPPRTEAIRAANPPVRQPLAPRLPDGRRTLMVGAHASHIDGMDKAASRALIDRLTGWATGPRFVYRHRWRVGDLVMWDNRCTMHKAMPYDLAAARRVLQRTTVVGDGPLV